MSYVFSLYVLTYTLYILHIPNKYDTYLGTFGKVGKFPIFLGKFPDFCYEFKTYGLTKLIKHDFYN